MRGLFAIVALFGILMAAGSVGLPQSVFAAGLVTEGGECSRAAGAVDAEKCAEGLVCIGGTDTAPGECLPELPEGPQTPGEVLDTIEVIANWVFAIFLAASVIFLVWGAFEFMLAQGDPAKISAAKQRLLYAVVGIGLAMLANGVDDILRSILT